MRTNLLRRAEYAIAAGRLTLLGIRFERLLRKYSPSQPRVPAGRPEGGQWTQVAGPYGIQAGGKWDNSRWVECELQYEKDLARCRGGACRDQAMLRLVNCMKGETLAPFHR